MKAIEETKYCKHCHYSIGDTVISTKVICTNPKSPHWQFKEKTKQGVRVSKHNSCEFYIREPGSEGDD